MRESCSYCEGHATVLDHVIPRSRGGTDSFSNKTPCCAPCNSSKNATPLGVWMARVALNPRDDREIRIRRRLQSQAIPDALDMDPAQFNEDLRAALWQRLVEATMEAHDIIITAHELLKVDWFDPFHAGETAPEEEP